MARGEIGLGSALLIGGGLALLGVALGQRQQSEPPPPPMPTMSEIMISLSAPRIPPAPTTTPNPRYPLPLESSRGERLERARMVRVYVYRIRCGELVLASPEIPPELSSEIADQLEGHCPPLSCGNAEGAMPLDWQ